MTTDIGRTIKDGSEGLGGLMDSFGGLLEKMGLPKETEGSKGSKLFHLLVYAMALKGTVDLATGDPGGQFRYFLEWLETGALETRSTGQRIYLEAKELVGKGSEAVLDYFNTAYELEGDDKLESKAQLAGFLTKKLPVVVKAMRDWEIPGNDHVIDWLDGKQEAFRKSGRFWDNVSIASIGLIIAALLGTIIGSEHDCFLGWLITLSVMVVTVFIVWRRKPRNNRPAIGAVFGSTGGGQ